MVKTVHGSSRRFFPPFRKPVTTRRPIVIRKSTTKPYTVQEHPVKVIRYSTVPESNMEETNVESNAGILAPEHHEPSSITEDAHIPTESIRPPRNPYNSYESTQNIPLLHIICICCLFVCTISLVILTTVLLTRFIARIRTERRKRAAEDLEKLPEIVPVPSIYFTTSGPGQGKGGEKPPSYQPSHASSYIYIPRDAHVVQSP